MICWYPIFEASPLFIPTEYSTLNVGVPEVVVIITSTSLPSSKAEPPPLTTTSGNGLTVIVAASIIRDEQFISFT